MGIINGGGAYPDGRTFTGWLLQVVGIATPLCLLFWFLVALPQRDAVKNVHDAVANVQSDVKALSEKVQTEHEDMQSRADTSETKAANLEQRLQFDETNWSMVKDALDKNTAAITQLTLQFTKFQEDRLRGIR